MTRTEQRIAAELGSIVEQLKHPKTDNPTRERLALVDELAVWMAELRAKAPMGAREGVRVEADWSAA